MQTQNKFFDDLAKVVNGMAGTVAGMGREAEAGVKERLRDLVGSDDMVSRDEFEAVKAMAILAREENEQLKARIDAIEAASKAAAPKKKPAAKK
ncbi:accessory factor UbiK family protein [Sphingomicrobium arenosum]|uniref:accessory factor UbiK family protein n=1 Tax=Sphingomicrobium arenosum TaxID=2233861 RepID=UPI00223FEF38|nr:accessory factor UbiK family protein [Sphingomicrobium arenosum]